MNKHRIYVILVSFIILSLLLVSVAAAAATKLPKPRLLEPDNDEILTVANACPQLIFNWSKVSHIDHYALYIDYLNVNEWIPVYGEWTYTNSNVTLPVGLSEGYTFRWYVDAVAYNPIRVSESRTKNNFTVNIDSHTCPT